MIINKNVVKGRVNNNIIINKIIKLIIKKHIIVYKKQDNRICINNKIICKIIYMVKISI